MLPHFLAFHLYIFYPFLFFCHSQTPTEPRIATRITPYLVQELHVDLTLVVFAFSVTSATAPIIGVLFGGWMVDRYGGYKGVRGTSLFCSLDASSVLHSYLYLILLCLAVTTHALFVFVCEFDLISLLILSVSFARTGLNVAAKIAAIFGLVAVLCGVPAIFSTSFVLTIVLIWLLLFFGGAVLPPATGILMSSVPPEMRALSNSVSMLLYNCLGYFLGPFLPGVVAQVTSAWRMPKKLQIWVFLEIVFTSFYSIFHVFILCNRFAELGLSSHPPLVVLCDLIYGPLVVVCTPRSSKRYGKLCVDTFLPF